MGIIIKSQKNGDEVFLSLEGSIDTRNAHEFEEEVKCLGNDISSILIDCEKLEYISSSGLRVLIMAYKKVLSNNGSLTLKNVNSTVKEVLSMTGMLSFLIII